MKPIAFFIDKSESFITNLNLIIPVDFDSSGWGVTNNENENTSKFEAQRSELYDIKFQIKLMLSEFDNGTLFIDKLESYKNTNFFSNEPLRISLIENVKLFIDYLNEYRI